MPTEHVELPEMLHGFPGFVPVSQGARRSVEILGHALARVLAAEAR
ncbi:hypothetical protein [Pseudonocardia kunmingensis]|uniref:Uncharacterized protein n=1 Tax=Pseudonocardia kunmingensis TaxID=630975 RepID=A0A543DP58_9PSEU|nr:hypothetical protein [Pseudonocardia kunmingensis]TQM11126.1 hypothetical protein FB558_3675 [Pseudonocardia kunmingensis]